MAGNDTKSTLLCHWNGPDGAKEIVDDGNTGHIVTCVGGANTSTVVKTIGNCSIYLDGDAYLSVPTSSDWNFGTSAFTLEAWIYLSAQGNHWVFGSDNSYFGIQIYHPNGNTYLIRGASNTAIAWDPAATTWYHVAWVFDGTDNKLFINGSQQGATWTNATSISQGAIRIGATDGGYLTGYMDEIRISNTARTIAAGGPSTAYTSDANTKLLLHCESHDTALGGSYLPATFVGTAQLDTAVKTFGTASLLLDGDSDYVQFPDNASWNLGAAGGGNDFTIDSRIRFTSLTGAQGIIATYTAGGTGWQIYWTANEIDVFTNAYLGSCAWTPVVDTWYHFAIVRSNTTITIYIDGSSIGTISDGDFNNDSTPLYIGKANTADSNFFKGYFDELRISREARWVANFTPPSAEYSEDAPTPPASTRRIFMIT